MTQPNSQDAGEERPTLTPEVLESLAARCLPRRGSTVFLPTIFDECADALAAAAAEIRRLQSIVKLLSDEIQAHDDHYAHHPHNACGWDFSVAAAAPGEGK